MADGANETGKVLKADDFSALSRARLGMREAEDAAAKIVEQARIDADRIRSEAETEGRERLAAMLTEHAALIDRDMKSTEAALTGVVMTILNRLLDPIPEVEVVTSTARRALKDIDTSRHVELRVAQDLAADVSAAFEGASFVVVRGDPTLSEGSSLLQTPYGDIELGLRAQLRAVAEGIDAASLNRDSV